MTKTEKIDGDSELLSRLERLEERLSAALENRDADRARIDRLVDERDVLQASLASVKDELEGLREAYGRLSEGRGTEGQSLTGASASNPDVAGSDNNSDLDSLRSAYGLLKHQYIALQEEYEAATQGLTINPKDQEDDVTARLKAERYGLERKLEAVRAEHESQSRELGELRAQVQSMETLRARLTRRLDDTIARLEALRAA